MKPSKKSPVTDNVKFTIAKAVAGVILAASAVPAMADDGNLSTVVPTSFIGDWFWAAAGLVVGAVVAVKGVQVIIRFIRRV